MCPMCKKGEIQEVLDDDLFTIKYNQCSHCKYTIPSDFKNLYHQEQIMQRFKGISLKDAPKPKIELLDYEQLNHNPKLKEGIIETWKELGMHCYSCNKPKLLTKDSNYSYCHNKECSQHLNISPRTEIKLK